MSSKRGLILVLGAALLLVWWWGGRRESRVTERVSEAQERSQESANLVAPADPESARTGLAREPTAPAVAELAPTEPVPAAPPAERFRLRGLLVHSSDRRPAGDQVLFFHYGRESTHVVSDANGWFETDPVLPRGALRAWHAGDVHRPASGEHLEIEPETFLLPDPKPSGAPGEIELALVDPAAWIEVEVLTTNGVPATAELRWAFRSREVSGEAQMQAGSWRTDERGRARLPFQRLDPGARLALFAREEEGLSSDLALVEAPLPAEPVRLTLEEGGRIRARLVGSDGKPLEGEQLTLRPKNLMLGALTDPDPEGLVNLLGMFMDGATSDAAGVGTFASLVSGRYRLDAWSDETSEWIRAETEVRRGETAEVELSPTRLPVAVAGRVVDENGEPVEGVEIYVELDNKIVPTVSDEAGAFSVGSETGGLVRIAIASEIFGDRFEPARIEVPFGTRDVLLRRVAPLPTTDLTLEILDRTTLARIPQVMVLGFVKPMRDNWTFHDATDGLVSIQLKLNDDVWLAVEAVGYRRQELHAVDLARARTGDTCRVLLEPGLARSLRILDEPSGASLLGARVFDGEREVATSDGEGRAAIDLPSWPVELRIRAAGHVEGVWACKDWISELGDGEVWLASAPESPDGK